MLDTHFTTMARYNAWANAEVYAAAATLPDAEYRRARPAAFFGSLHGTLNHLLVVDRLWFGRIDGSDPGRLTLDQILHEDFAELRAAREREDRRIVTVVEGLDEAALAAPLRYTRPNGTLCVNPLASVLLHMVLHAVHHRGQVHDMLSQTAVPPPSLDMHRVLKPNPDD